MDNIFLAGFLTSFLSFLMPLNGNSPAVEGDCASMAMRAPSSSRCSGLYWRYVFNYLFRDNNAVVINLTLKECSTGTRRVFVGRPSGPHLKRERGAAQAPVAQRGLVGGRTTVTVLVQVLKCGKRHLGFFLSGKFMTSSR